MTEKQYTITFKVEVYRNGKFDYSKNTFCTMSADVALITNGALLREKLRTRASHLIKEGKREEYEMVHGSCFGERVTIERKLGHILSVREIRPIETPTDYSHAYAEDSRYNYNG